jgi:hypothetical protein
VVTLTSRRVLILSTGVELLFVPFEVLVAPKVFQLPLVSFVSIVHIGHTQRLCEGFWEKAGEKLEHVRRGRVVPLSPRLLSLFGSVFASCLFSMR